MRRLIAGSLFLVSFVTLASLGSPAAADMVGSRENEYGRITRIRKGTFQIGADSLFILSYDKAGEADGVLNVTFAPAVSFSWVARDNLSIGIEGGLLWEKSGDVATNTSFFGGLLASYYFRLGGGMFFRPGIGAGVLFGTNEVDAGGGLKVESDLFGVTAKLALPFTYFTSNKFSLNAGPVFLLTFGSVTPEGADEGESFTGIDGGFSVGFTYNF